MEPILKSALWLLTLFGDLDLWRHLCIARPLICAGIAAGLLPNVSVSSCDQEVSGARNLPARFKGSFHLPAFLQTAGVVHRTGSSADLSFRRQPTRKRFAWSWLLWISADPGWGTQRSLASSQRAQVIPRNQIAKYDDACTAPSVSRLAWTNPTVPLGAWRAWDTRLEHLMHKANHVAF